MMINPKYNSKKYECFQPGPAAFENYPTGKVQNIW